MADPIGGITLFVQQQPTTAGDTFLDPDSRTQQASVGLDNRVPNSYSFNFCTKLLTKAVDAQPLPVRPLLYLAGPQQCWEKNSPSFQSWVLESRGISFADYLVKRLSERDYLRWVELFATTTLAPPK